MKIWTTFAILFLLTAPVWAQHTTVSGQVIDLNSQIYRNCTGTANFAGQNNTSGAGPYSLGGSTFQTVVPIFCDGAGNFSISLADNNQITPTPSQWRFTIQTAAGAFPGPPIGFNCLVTITGSTQNVTAALTICAVLLPISGIQLQTDSVNNHSQGLLNFVDSATVTWSNPSGGIEQATAVPGTGTTNRLAVWTAPTVLGSSVITDPLISDSSVGTSANTSEKWFWQYRPTACPNIANSCIGSDLELVWQTAANLPSAILRGVFVNANISTNTAGTNTIAAVHGIDIQAVNGGASGGGTMAITELTGVYAFATSPGNGGTAATTTRQAAIRAVTDTSINLPDNRGIDVLSGGTGSDTITNDYGIYVRTPQTTSNMTNHYGIYVDDQTTGVSGAAIGVNVVKDVIKTGSVLFANLPTGGNAPNGSSIYCSDCNNACSAGSSTGNTCFREAGAWVGKANNPILSIQVASLTTNTGTAIGASATTWITKAITMPSSGCPCRVLVSYGMLFTAGASGTAVCWVDDNNGSGNVFATNSTLTAAAGGHNASCTGSSISPVTYANSAVVTFVGRGDTDASGGLTVASGQFGSTQASWLSIAVLSSN